jgi:2-keto-4-pentenoate hydratase/2-oxohepta-3-ene-1,7-dioic acid hydratase in catechol pathway
MRLATLADRAVAVVRNGSLLPLGAEFGSMRELAAGGAAALVRIGAWAGSQPKGAWLPLSDGLLGPAMPDPGAIFTIGLNYRTLDDPDSDLPPRPLVFGKLPTSVASHNATLTWDRALTEHVDAECELGVVIGPGGDVFGYTVVNDVSSRDEWLDGDQWLLGKSMPGFCPVGPWIVTADELDPADLRLGCTINGDAIQDSRTSQMRFPIGDVIAYLDAHVTLRPGDLIVSGTPPRLLTPPGPDRHLQHGDIVTCWIEGIGELTTRVALVGAATTTASDEKLFSTGKDLDLA